LSTSAEAFRRPVVRRLALRLVEHLRLLTDEIDELTAEITVRVTPVAPSLLAIVGCGALFARSTHDERER
jgi:transposase